MWIEGNIRTGVQAMAFQWLWCAVNLYIDCIKLSAIETLKYLKDITFKKNFYTEQKVIK